jgi:putative ABC transport system substrate-binding protein
VAGGGAGAAVAATAADRRARAGDENDPLSKPRLSTFTQALAGLGWTDGRNVRMDLRWGGADANRMRPLAQELVGLQPDILVTSTTSAT